ncbi:Uncharacterized protein TCM_041527 [Theobroma cacao]|uniref:Uncharacterized protein n=1 Tax=Theobroma cacao TaxID=3641 RepID=A0A061GZT4_THECC|nr:Uncharacterized protein TCM_041527 [Theobroma cacao]
MMMTVPMCCFFAIFLRLYGVKFFNGGGYNGSYQTLWNSLLKLGRLPFSGNLEENMIDDLHNMKFNVDGSFKGKLGLLGCDSVIKDKHH